MKRMWIYEDGDKIPPGAKWVTIVGDVPADMIGTDLCNGCTVTIPMRNAPRRNSVRGNWLKRIIGKILDMREL